MMGNLLVPIALEFGGLFVFALFLFWCPGFGSISEIMFFTGLGVLLVCTFFATLTLVSVEPTEEMENQSIKEHLGLSLIIFGFLYAGVFLVYFTMDSTTGFIGVIGGYFVSEQSLSTFVLILFALTFTIIVAVWLARLGLNISRKRLEPAFKTAVGITLVALVLGGAFVGFAYVSSYAINTARDNRLPLYYNEKVAINGVSANANCVFVQNSGEKNVTIAYASVKDVFGNTVMQAEVVGGERFLPVSSSQETIVLGVDLLTLPSGTYTITLVSTNGGYFVSPPFTVP